MTEEYKLALNFQPFPLLQTERLILRKITMADVEQIFFLRSDAAVLQYLHRAPAKSADDAAVWINNLEGWEKSFSGITWGLCTKESNELIGTICFWNIQQENLRAEIGYALHPKQQGKGFMQEAMKTILVYGFRVMNFHSVEAHVYPQNLGSIKLLQKNGFVQEAYFKENIFFNGGFSDSVAYSLLRQNLSTT
ncbi:MAG: GNAT family protein [Bacteroidota bacterium]